LGSAAALETPGIVLIDEVDMHLHPEWQQVVLQSLTTAFPKVQFIVTTHSPQVLSTVRRESIRVIHKTDAGYEAMMPAMSPLAREAGDALAYVMDTHTRPQIPLLNDIHEYEQLVRTGQDDSEAGRKVRQRLDAAGYEIPASDLVTWRFLASRRALPVG
jgi:predicted ATP-binding protein involved in virulence